MFRRHEAPRRDEDVTTEDLQHVDQKKGNNDSRSCDQKICLPACLSLAHLLRHASGEEKVRQRSKEQQARRHQEAEPPGSHPAQVFRVQLDLVCKRTNSGQPHSAERLSGPSVYGVSTEKLQQEKNAQLQHMELQKQVTSGQGT